MFLYKVTYKGGNTSKVFQAENNTRSATVHDL